MTPPARTYTGHMQIFFRRVSGIWHMGSTRCGFSIRRNTSYKYIKLPQIVWHFEKSGVYLREIYRQIHNKGEYGN